MKTCDGCRFQGSKATCKRCLTCSRNYADKHQAPPTPKPMTHEQKMALAQLTGLAAGLLAGNQYSSGKTNKKGPA